MAALNMLLKISILLFTNWASFKVIGFEVVLSVLAKSTKVIFESLVSPKIFLSIQIEKRQCDLELCSN